MFITNILFLTILAFVIGVSSSVFSEDTHVHRRYVKRLAGGNYNYNYPPTAKNIEPIPVSIVYDDGEIRQEKSISTNRNQSTVKVSEKTTETIQTTAKPQNSVLNNKDSDFKSVDNNKELKNAEEISTTKEPSDDVEKVNIQNKGNRNDNNADNVQIPVAIVYEAKSDTQKDNSLRITNDLKRRRGNPRRRSENSNATENIKIENNYAESQSNLSVTTDAPQSVTNKIVGTTNKEPQNKTTTKTANDDKNPQKEQTDKTEIKKRTRQRDPVVPIVESENYVYSHNGEFHYSYEGGDGTKAFEKGELKSFDDDKTGEAVVGGFSYKDKDGNDFSLSYTADENGYRPIGAHLPTPPPIPPAIARALKYLATKTTPEPVTETSTN